MMTHLCRHAAFLAVSSLAAALHAADKATPALACEAPHWLSIHGEHLPGKSIRINCREACCRVGSTDADWVMHTVIKRTAEVISSGDDRKILTLRDIVADGLVVDHTITAADDNVWTSGSPRAMQRQRHPKSTWRRPASSWAVSLVSPRKAGPRETICQSASSLSMENARASMRSGPGPGKRAMFPTRSGVPSPCRAPM